MKEAARWAIAFCNLADDIDIKIEKYNELEDQNQQAGKDAQHTIYSVIITLIIAIHSQRRSTSL